MSTEDRVTALRDLLQSPGWALFWAYAKQEYGPAGYGRKMQAALAGVAAGPGRADEIARTVERIDGVVQEVNVLMEWPKRMIQQWAPEATDRRPFAELRRGPR